MPTPTPTSNPAAPAGTQPTDPADPAERACVLAGCGDPPAWIVTDPQGGQLPCCEADVTKVINHALARIPRHSTLRLEVQRA